MKFLSILLALMGMLIAYFGIHLVLNRGKIRFVYLITAVLYSFAVGVPVAYFSGAPEKLPVFFYILYYMILLFPYFGFELYKCIRGRQAWGPVILIITGITLILLSPALEYPEKPVSIILGLLLVTGFFIHLFRYPHLNAMWLADAAKQAAKSVEKNCRYSPKPIVVPVSSPRTSSTSAIGLYLLFKKDKAIVKMSKDFHDKLGRPNMEAYARELVGFIKNKIRKEDGSLQATLTRNGG